MGDFGVFEINVDGVTQHLGNTVVGPLPKGTYEPKDADELAALQQLATVPFTPEGGEETTYATMTTPPVEPAPVIPDASAGTGEAPLSEPPATTSTPAGTTTPEPAPAAPSAGAAGDAAPAASPTTTE